MGYSIQTSGSIHLPAGTEPQALVDLESRLARLAGWFDPEQLDRIGQPVDTLDDLARFVGATATREGDWLTFSTDHDGDPKWSEQATGFYEGLSRWVARGEVHLRGEDGVEWSYRYGPDGVIQVGRNGWDGSLMPFGPPVLAGGEDTGAQARSGSDHAPMSTGRAVAMTLLLVVGVIAIIGVAALVAGV